MQLLARYNVIDVVKLFMAFLVIGIHVETLFGTEYPQFVDYVLESAVPFFFICSGYFIQNKIVKKGKKISVLKDSCKKISETIHSLASRILSSCIKVSIG